MSWLDAFTTEIDRLKKLAINAPRIRVHESSSTAWTTLYCGPVAITLGNGKADHDKVVKVNGLLMEIFESLSTKEPRP